MENKRHAGRCHAASIAAGVELRSRPRLPLAPTMAHKHAVHLLFEQRLARSTRPFLARGGRVVRCTQCRLALAQCTCSLRPSPLPSQAGFVLLMHDDEVLKPSNSGRLIADLIGDTHAFIWSRTSVEPGLLQLLDDPRWYPLVVFPGHYACPPRPCLEALPPLAAGQRPLFILLDGSWREACKMFRKSPYLDRFAVLSITPEQSSRYQVRTASHDHQLATAEVAAQLLALAGEEDNARILDCWFDLFTYRYQLAVHQQRQGDSSAEARLQLLLGGNE